jgi:deoxycytidine triphosphate deaminase
MINITGGFMAILSRAKIIEAIENGKLAFDPGLDKFQFSPIAIDLRVGSNFFVPRLSEMGEKGRTEISVDHLDNKTNNEILDQIHLEPGQVFHLLPGEFILISSLEKISIKTGDIMATLFPRSSTSRRGLSIESGVVDPFYEGFLTIPVLNQTKTQTIKIYPGERIAQLVFQEIGQVVSTEEAESHGLSKPKYQGTKAYMLDYKFDPHEELGLLKDGKIEELKEGYAVEIKTKEKKIDEKQQLSI